MTWLFWVLIAFMTGLALWIIIPGLLKEEDSNESVLDHENIGLARQRLKELKTQLSTSSITEKQYQEQYSELEILLNDDLGLTKNNQKTITSGKWVIFPIAAGFPVMAICLYVVLGNYDAIERPRSANNQTMPDINQMVSGLEKKLIDNPDDAEGWVMLGRSYKVLKQFQKASNAFAQALRLTGEKTELLLQFADTQAMANGGSLKGKPTEYIEKAVKQSPDNQTALWFAGIAKAQSGAFKEALEYWLHLKTLLSPDSQSYQELMSLITNLQGQIQGAENLKEQAVTSQVSLKIRVSLSPAMKLLTQPEHTVFIYAQALNGPKLPLAIVREQVKNLPVTVTLSDQQAMSPKAKLSEFKQVKLLARVSKSGNAMTQKGDLIGALSPVQTKNNKLIKLDISRELE